MAVTSVMKLLRRNRVDNATLSSNVSVLKPLANIQDEILKRKTRLNGTSNVQLTVQILGGSPWNINVVVVAGTNLTPAATILVESSPDGSAWTTETTITIESPVNNFNQGGFGDLGFGGYNDEETRQDPPQKAYFYMPATGVNNDWWRLTFNDTGNAAGYIEVGRVGLGTMLEPTYNITEFEIGIEDPSSKERSPSGVSWKDKKDVWRTASFAWDKAMPKADVFAPWLFNISKVGISTPLFAFFAPTDTTKMKDWLVMYGEFQSLSGFRWHAATIYSTGRLVFEEVY